MDDSTTTFTPPTLESLQELFPNYVLTEFLAQGGMGAVYSAYQESLDRHVAIKILPPEFSADTSFRESFTTEARAMAKLNHPNLISVYDFGEAGGMLYLIMELVSGGSLYQAIYGEMADQKASVDIISKLAKALGHAHENGLIHRDIKPANILMDEQGNPKIGDFGLARSLSDGEEVGDIFGTPGYTAPEVLVNPRAVDQRADIFSLGVTLYEMLTSHLPQDPFKPASLICECDRRIDNIISRAIHRAPEMRYSTAAEFASDLDALGSLAEGTIQTQAPTLRAVPAQGAIRTTASARRAGTQLKSAKSSNSGLIMVVLLLIAGGVLYMAYKQGLFEAKAQEKPEKTEIKTLTD